jgi:hypothetical protein
MSMAEPFALLSPVIEQNGAGWRRPRRLFCDSGGNGGASAIGRRLLRACVE